jgi:hypothetical protein
MMLTVSVRQFLSLDREVKTIKVWTLHIFDNEEQSQNFPVEFRIICIARYVIGKYA